jgi:hypothetical protein
MYRFCNVSFNINVLYSNMFFSLWNIAVSQDDLVYEYMCIYLYCIRYVNFLSLITVSPSGWNSAFIYFLSYSAGIGT